MIQWPTLHVHRTQNTLGAVFDKVQLKWLLIDSLYKLGKCGIFKWCIVGAVSWQTVIRGTKTNIYGNVLHSYILQTQQITKLSHKVLGQRVKVFGSE